VYHLLKSTYTNNPSSYITELAFMPGKRKRRQRFHVLLSVLYKRMRTDVMETVKSAAVGKRKL
jgi:hypothetical protein